MSGPVADPYTALAYARAVEAKAIAQRERLEAALHATVPQSRTHTSPWMRRDGGLAALPGPAPRTVARGHPRTADHRRWKGVGRMSDDPRIEAALAHFGPPTDKATLRLRVTLQRTRDVFDAVDPLRQPGIVCIDTNDEDLLNVLSAKIKDAYYHARDTGGTVHTAADDAARAVLAALAARGQQP